MHFMIQFVYDSACLGTARVSEKKYWEEVKNVAILHFYQTADHLSFLSSLSSCNQSLTSAESNSVEALVAAIVRAKIAII